MAKLIILVAVVITLCSHNAKADLPPGGEECLTKSGATLADVEARPRKTTSEVRCFWKCVMEKNAMIDASGVLHTDMFEKSFPKAASTFEPKVIADIKTCLTTVGPITTCDDVSKIRECFEKSLHK